MFSLIIAEQKSANIPNRSYYETKEVTLLCKYIVSRDEPFRAGLLRSAAVVGYEGDPFARSLDPIQIYESPILTIREG